MTPEQEEYEAKLIEVTDAEQHARFALLAGEAVLRGARAPYDMAVALEGLLAAVRRCGNALNAARVYLESEPVPRRGKPDARANRDHRHKFGPDNRCAVPGCGKEKGAGGRPPKVDADAPPVDTRTVPLPFKPNKAGADRFVDGGLGSSGMRR